MTLNLSTLKLSSAAIVLLLTVISAWWPFKKRLTSSKGYEFPIGEALASGVFLGAGLIHMLGDASHDFTAMGYQYPFAFLLAGVAFLALLFLEHVTRELKHHNSNSSTIAILAVVLLSLHSFLAGAALGFSDDINTTIIILIAILAHKWAASFALSIQINKSPMSLKLRLLYFAIFVTMTPLGILIGNDATPVLNHHNILTPTFISLAAGTFLYIGTLHGLGRAVMIERCCNLREFSFVIFGFALMAVVAVWT